MTQITISELKQQFQGNIIEPTDAQYDQARTTMMKKGTPVLVVQPVHAADVALALSYAQAQKLVVSVRSGGHSGAGFGTNDGGLVIDMAKFNTIEVIDTQNNIVRVGSGAQWGDVAQKLQQYHLAISSGDTRTVGVGGLTLGGGIGWMVRKVGLTIDNLVAAEVVTAQGDVIRTSETAAAELFWAIRGGGGNFGIVTYFEFKAQPIGQVYAGSLSYDLTAIEELLRGWRDYMRQATEDLTTMFLVMPSFAGNPPMVMVLCCFAGDDEQAAKAAIDPLRKIGKVLSDTITRKNYAEVLEEAHQPEGVKIIVNNAFADELSDDLILAIAEAQKSPSGFILQMRSVGGAMNRVKADATAFAHRNKEALLISPVFIPLTATESEIEAAQSNWRNIEPFTSGSYMNFFTESNAQKVAAAYPPTTLQRLIEIKKTYDPTNIFNQNCNFT